MILSIHSSGAFQIADGWPKFWPPVQLPPPSPLAAAATSLWTPTPERDTNASLYSTQLNQGGQPGSADGQGGFQMHFIDQRIALMRYDASHTQDSAPAQDSVPVSRPVPSGGVAA